MTLWLKCWIGKGLLLPWPVVVSAGFGPALVYCVLCRLDGTKWTLSDENDDDDAFAAVIAPRIFFLFLCSVYCLPLYFLREKGSIGERYCAWLLPVRLYTTCCTKCWQFYRILFYYFALKCTKCDRIGEVSPSRRNAFCTFYRISSITIWFFIFENWG